LLVLVAGAACPVWKVWEESAVGTSCPPIKRKPLWCLLRQFPELAQDARMSPQGGKFLFQFDHDELMRFVLLVVVACAVGTLASWASRWLGRPEAS
jgi:hypothetical protein